ncbi:subtilisin-like protein [Lactarius quietus]|nr:subtilisin-like protein [Lactarius quietus]
MRYHCITNLSVLAAVPLLSLATPLSSLWDDMHIKHTWDAVPESWEGLGQPPSGTTIDLYVGLKPEHENALIDALYEVSSPKHPKYGKHLSKEQVAGLVAPHPNALELVNSWLGHHGIPASSVSVTHGGGTLMLRGVSVTQANILLGASYQLYKHVYSSETIVRTVGYALPMVLHEHILTVVPTTTFFPPPRQWQTPQNFSSEAATWLVKSGELGATLSSRRDPVKHTLSPSFLRSLYRTETYVPAATDRNALGIGGFMNDYPNPDDLAMFMNKYRADALDATYNVELVNGGQYNPGEPTLEAELDIQVAEGIAYPTPVTFYSTGESPSDGPPPPLGKDDRLTAWLKYLLALRKIPQTISLSYGPDERLATQEYSGYVCDLFAQLGARGVSVLASTSDDGVGKPEYCKAPDGSIRFYTYFPATCPYVTAVGGTTDIDPERGAEISGGGFSNYFRRPDFQKDAVPKFLDALGSQYRGFFNPLGRGIPDVAAQIAAFPIFIKGELKFVGGTSGSAPTVAAIFSLLNDYELSKGRDPLGWLNPWLYDSGYEKLWDITTGSNPGCGTPGFSAIVGWDPVTGLGTPDFPEMQEQRDEMAARAPSNPSGAPTESPTQS